MNWWQGLWETLSALGWGWIIILVFATLLIGILLSTLIVYMVLRLRYTENIRYFDMFHLLINRNKNQIFVGHEPLSDLDLGNHIADTASNARQTTENTKVEFIPLPTALIKEFDYNLLGINNFNSKTLPSLKNTALLEYLSSTNTLPPYLVSQFEDVEKDITLWNEIVCIATEMSHQSDFSNELYKKSLFNIANRLQLIRRNGQGIKLGRNNP